jgi:hypothetical protein
MTAWLAAFLLFIVFGVGAVAGFVGHRLIHLKGQKRTAQANQVAANLITQWRRNETVATRRRLLASKIATTVPPTSSE